MNKLSKRRAFVLGLFGIGGLTAWRFRVPQVCSFLAAAGARKMLTPDVAPDFQALKSQWTSLKPLEAYSASLSRGMITYHPWYHNFRPSMAVKCLAETAKLGAGWIRVDIRWKDLMPDGREVDEAAWKWYENYLRAANDWYELRPLVVLSNAPSRVLQESVDSRLAAWNRYVDEVARRAGSLCSVYQLLNEPNNPIYRIFPFKATAAAILSAAKTIRLHNADARIVINILGGIWGWPSYLEQILRECGSAVDIVGLDYYPGTWTVSENGDSLQWNQFLDFVVRERETRGSPLRDRTLAIIETGYATNIRWWRSEEGQVKYFQTLENAFKRLEAEMGRDGLALVGIHELCDGDTEALLDPEAHFGLLTSELLKRKPAFDVVRRIFSAAR